VLTHRRCPDVPQAERARIHTELGNEHFFREHGPAPIDDRERGSFMAKATRQQTTAVAGYDLTFAPVKSVSTLWALADRDVAKQIEDAHHSAVEATLSCAGPSRKPNPYGALPRQGRRRRCSPAGDRQTVTKAAVGSS
jgi:hypothetical protein